MIYRTETLERATKLANYIVENNSTIRETGKVFGVPKSTVHTDVTERIRYVNWNLYLQVDKVLKYNLSQRATRGGQATKRKYKK